MTRASIGVGAMLDEKLLHICMVYHVPTNDGIPAIWMAVVSVKTQQEGHSRLVTLLMSGIPDYRRDFYSHANLPHCNILLHTFVARHMCVTSG